MTVRELTLKYFITILKMSCKRPASSPAASTPHRKRASYGLDIKLEVIRRKNAGVSAIDISARHLVVLR